MNTFYNLYRIDFEDFTIVGPSNSAEYDEGGTWSDTAAGGGKCAKDTLVITGPSDANANVPTICGQNTGQHSKISHLRCVLKV